MSREAAAPSGRVDRLRGSIEVLPAVAFALGLAVQVAYAVYLADRLWFFGDDWDFLLRRGVLGDHERSIWFPHNEHWSTVPILLFRSMFAMFGLESYLPYALLPIVAHVAIWVAMYVLLRGIGIAPWPTAVSAWVGAFLAGGAGAQNTLWDFQVGFLGSAVFGLLACLLGRQNGHWRLVGTWTALTLSLACSGIGLIFVGWKCLEVLIRRGMPAALAAGSVPGAAYALWFALVGHEADHAIKKDVTAFPLRLFEGLDAVWSTALLMPGAGAAALAGLVYVVFYRPHPQPAFSLAASGLGALLAAFTLFAYARSGLGADATEPSRYMYFGIMFCVPALALVVGMVSTRLPAHALARPVAVAVILALTGALGMAHLNRYADGRVETVGGLQSRLAATTLLMDEGNRMLWQMPSPERNPDITVTGLEQVRGEFGDVRVSRSERLDARGQLQVVVGKTASASLPSAREVSWIGLDSRPRKRTTPLDTCSTRAVTGEEGFVTLAVPTRGASIEVRTGDNNEIETSLIDGRLVSEPVHWNVDSDEFVTVATTATGTHLQIRLPHGEATVCRVGQSRS